jgi:hypothetical protein
MRIKRSVTSLLVQTMVTGAIATGLAVVAPDTYFDMDGNAVTRTLVVSDSATTTPAVTPDTYFDMD